MSELVELAFRNRNPDVLTCIANLSNDEVFTPPELVGQMLDALANAWAMSHDGEDIWRNSSLRFLDPFTKSGVFLREIVTRLMAGLAEEIPELQERVDHVLTKQVFGIALTTLTSLLARRSVYCSKWANGRHSIATAFENADGNIWFESKDHSWVGGRERLIAVDAGGEPVEKTVDGKCRYCGANQVDYERETGLETHAYAFIHSDDPRALVSQLFGEEMHFDVVIGNPPYQLGSSGGESIGGFAMPIYQKFIDAAKRLDPKFVVMVTPSRWFAGGRGLDEFRAEMLADHRLRALVDFPDATDAFPGTQIKGGVSYFVWDSGWDGECDVTTMEDGKPTSATMSRWLDSYDVLVRRNEAVPILEKVAKQNATDGHGNLGSKVSAIQPFSLRTNFKGAATPAGLGDPIRLIGNGGETYIERSEVPRNDAWVDQWKVLLGAAYGAGDSFPHQIYNYPIIAGPGSACTETYLVIDRFSSEVEADRFAAYLRTRLVRFLVSLRKYTQHLYSERFSFVPDLPMDRTWTDEALYEKYGITEDEVAFIETMVRPMEGVVA